MEVVLFERLDTQAVIQVFGVKTGHPGIKARCNKKRIPKR
jgi:hypothetical protein